jgi:hypothetical protein
MAGGDTMGSKGFRRHSRVVWPGFSYNPRPRQVAKVGRNDPCPCGSGKKYKECHEVEGTAFLEKLAWKEAKRLHREERRRRRAASPPWWRRWFGRRPSGDHGDEVGGPRG